ncbi:PLATZ transcription factor family [Micractinium conductrix]|uniref:PLATZ transcription factor family n=1 Tax=Micractinium conductrix TaxID=554055 RepID=A0A2P6VQ05_9CHLO|nr:PLATZ transcription factor family [Micractinium conductrix]|eukprot:PSC76161.1 PLATZ transcription factor family [Micractinium conductrix]
MEGCLAAPGLLPFFRQILMQDTPTSSADEADLHKRPVLKSPLAKHDQMSAAMGSDSEDDSAAACVVDSRPQAPLQLPVDMTLPLGQLPVMPLPQLPGCSQQDLLAACMPDMQPVAGPSGRGVASAAGPAPWLMGLFTCSMFEHHGCRCHPGSVRNGTVKRNENNQYCLDCTHVVGSAICKLCLSGHAASCPGRVFQIRKYMYQTCVHVDDIQPLYDVSGVQAYCINSRRAVLIHPKNVEKEQKCPAFDHSCLGCHKPLRHDCTYCSLRCKVDVEYGFAPITPKGCLTPRDDGGVPAAVAAAAANMLLTAPPSARQQGGSRLASVGKRPPPYAGVAAAAAAFAASTLDVSHATRCSSGGEAGSSRSKRRKGNLPERSHMS